MLQNDTKSLVPAAYFKMFSLRLLGYTYAQIADKTGYSEAHVRRLFAKGGVLHSMWQDFQQTATEEAKDDSITMMYGHLPDITRALIMQAKSMGPGAIRAAEIIFSYTLGKPKSYFNPEAETEELSLTDLIKYEAQKEKVLSMFRWVNQKTQ